MSWITILSEEDRLKFDNLSNIIENNYFTFLDVGTSFARILENEWYLQSHSSFEEYLQEKCMVCEKHSHALHFAILAFLELKQKNIGSCKCPHRFF